MVLAAVIVVSPGFQTITNESGRKEYAAEKEEGI